MGDLPLTGGRTHIPRNNMGTLAVVFKLDINYDYKIYECSRQKKQHKYSSG